MRDLKERGRIMDEYQTEKKDISKKKKDRIAFFLEKSFPLEMDRDSWSIKMARDSGGSRLQAVTR